MSDFHAPVSDISHALTVAGFDALLGKAPFAEVDRETVEAVLAGAGEFASGVLAPLNRIGDTKGPTFANGKVTAAPGFANAYRQYWQGGWAGLSVDPKFGGQGLPTAVSLAKFEMVNAANMAFALCPILSEAAMDQLQTNGTARQQKLYLPKLVSGEWTGTMILTEAQAGSDLSLVRAKAEKDGDHYRLTGQKIFITWGDHDCAENIINIVLARLSDAPPGVKGLSLFLVPKILVKEDGSLGAANALRPLSIEHKLGIHGSPTCVMSYEGAYAEMIGTPGEGLPLMFLMMNAARLQIGMQGVGLAERATQHALAYARVRLQGRSPWNRQSPAPIFDQPDVRRMLMLMKAKTEAARAICFATAVASDLAEYSPNEYTRAALKLREEILVPIAKAWSSDVGVEVASLGVQVHGGAGYIEETGAAQYYRDARISPIYEGTNGIQAMDLAGRKLGLEDGKGVRDLLIEMRSTQLADKALTASLHAAVAACERATDWMILNRGSADSLGAATTYLKLMGDTIGGWMLAKGADSEARLSLARFYAAQVLTLAPGLADTVQSGAADLLTADIFPAD
jgi:alkylation response protein AidB-like acyl-CoA dehydrogenase